MNQQSKDENLATLPRHLEPIYRGVAGGLFSAALITHGQARLEPPKLGAGFIAFIGDDTDCSLGPRGFIQEVLASVLTKTDLVLIVACAPEWVLYAHAALEASIGRFVAIIETRSAHEDEWVSFVTAARPQARMVVGTAVASRA